MDIRLACVWLLLSGIWLCRYAATGEVVDLVIALSYQAIAIVLVSSSRGAS